MTATRHEVAPAVKYAPKRLRPATPDEDAAPPVFGMRIFATIEDLAEMILVGRWNHKPVTA